MGNMIHSRRKFMTKTYHLTKTLLFWNLFLAPSRLFRPNASATEKNMNYKPSDPGLKEIARQKFHHGNSRFINPFKDEQKRNFRQLIKWKFFSKNHYKHYYPEEPVVPVTIDWAPIKAHKGLSVTFINHACVMIKDGDTSILTDPVFFGLHPMFTNFTPVQFDIKKMPPPGHVLITHGHYDHLDRDSLKVLGPATHIITPLGYNALFNELSVTYRTPLDWFDCFESTQVKITLLPCDHWTMRNPVAGPNRSLWGAYLIQTHDGFTIFVSGDTAYFQGFREIGEAFHIDLAIFNLGAYEPRWLMGKSHMNPAETVNAFIDLKAEKMFIVHWGTFRLGDEPVHFPPMDIKRELAKQGLSDRLVNLSHGQTLFIDS